MGFYLRLIQPTTSFATACQNLLEQNSIRPYVGVIVLSKQVWSFDGKDMPWERKLLRHSTSITRAWPNTCTSTIRSTLKVGSDVYYLTDVNYEAWRAQDTSRRNSKNHFVDCSELVSTVT